MKKIMFLMNSLAFGGAEKVVINLYNNINREQFDVHLVYFEDRKDLLFQIEKPLFSNTECLHKSSKVDFRMFQKLKKRISREHFDAVICTCEYSMLYAYLIKRAFKYDFNLTVVIHGTIILNAYRKLKNMLYKRIMNKCDNVLFVCGNQMRYWIDNYNINFNLCNYIYNGIDVDLFKDQYGEEEKGEIRDKLGFKKHDIVIGICAVLRPEKKHEDLILAVDNLVNKGINIKLLIIGDGPRRIFLERYIEELGITEHITITGFIKDVRPYLSISDILVITSHAVETFSIAILEGMAMSKCIIATDIGGASEMVKNGENGYLYPAGDIDLLISKIEDVVTKEKYRLMGKNSRKIVEKYFTLEKMIREYERYLEDMGTDTIQKNNG